MNAEQLFEKLRQDAKLKKFLSIIEDKPRYPVFHDANRNVLSLPPIINSDKTKITLDTKNVFIEMTGTDLHKIEMSLVIVAGLFSYHCQGDSQFTIEEVEVHHEGSDKVEVYPKLNYIDFDVELDYMNRTLGLNLNVDQVKECAAKMGLVVKEVKNNNTVVVVEVPPTRPDIIHACDIAEDIGIAYGYNNIPKIFPPTNTIGRQIPQNKFTDLLRLELA
jgi:phenylalanyl-tRNA synthetase beta chain